jgi:hypothetical protein
VFLNKLVTFHDLFLGEWEESSREHGGSFREEFDGIIPDGVGWQSL